MERDDSNLTACEGRSEVREYELLLTEDYAAIPDVHAAVEDMRRAKGDMVTRLSNREPLARAALGMLRAFSNRLRYGSRFATSNVWRMRASARCPLVSKQ